MASKPPSSDPPKRELRDSTTQVRKEKEEAEAKKMKVSTESCESFLGKIKKERRTKTLKNHVQAIYAHEHTYKERLEKEPEVAAHKAKITEAKGEISATAYMLETYPQCEIVCGFSPGVGIDQVYVERDKGGKITKIYVVEAKGEGAGLSKGADKGDQMSDRWVTNSVLAMKPETAAEKEVQQEMIKALKDPHHPVELQGLVIGIDKGSVSEQPLPKEAQYPKGGDFRGSYKT